MHMARVRRPPLRAGALALALALALGVLAWAPPARAIPACAEAVLDDWARGRLRPSYPPPCYEAALEALPEDLRAYTTAAEDIRRAALAAARRPSGWAAAREPERRLAMVLQERRDLRAPPGHVLALAATVVALSVAGLAAALARRRRAR